MLEKLRNKKVYIYGLGVFGLAISNWLSYNDIVVAGGIDKNWREMNTECVGFPVYGPEDVKRIVSKDSVILLCISRTSPALYVKHQLELMGLSNGKDFLSFENQMDIYIDVTNICNLKCKSCAVGNVKEANLQPTSKGFMDKEIFEKIIQKCKKNYPENRCIYLYMFGDPLLHPDLNDLLQILHKYGLSSILSSNLSQEIDIKEFVKSRPDILKVSVSGFYNSVYQTTHNGGDIRLVKSNLYRLRYYIDLYQTDMKVIVGYHIYNNNTTQDYQAMKHLCEELRFIFQPEKAKYNGLFKCAGLSEFNSDDREFVKKFYDNYQDIYQNILKPSHIPDNKYCYLWKSNIAIDYDGKLKLCCIGYGSRGEYGKSFLDSNLEDYLVWRKNHPMCRICMQYDYCDENMLYIQKYPC